VVGGGKNVPSTSGDGGVVTAAGVRDEDVTDGGCECRVRSGLEEGGDEGLR